MKKRNYGYIIGVSLLMVALLVVVIDRYYGIGQTMSDRIDIIGYIKMAFGVSLGSLIVGLINEIQDIIIKRRIRKEREMMEKEMEVENELIENN